MNEKIRLQKLLSQCGYCSRREAENLIRYRKVYLNGELATLGDRANTKDTIMIEGKHISLQKQVLKTIAWYKPINVETTLAPARDPSYQTLIDFNFGPERVFPIGRLDKNSRGLLLLTTDGELANKLMHPRYEKEKEYRVKIEKTGKGKLKGLKECASILSQGVLIDTKKTKPCTVEVIGPNELRFVLKEGRNRQIRKMCEAIGLEVIDLFRVRFGDVALDTLKLEAGEWKEVEIGIN